MFEVIKGSSPFKNIVIEGNAVINNKIAGLDDLETPEEKETKEEKEKEKDGEETSADGTEDAETEEVKEEAPRIDFHELEELREQYRREGQEYAVALHKKADAELEEAKAEAERISEEAKEKGRRLLAQIDEKAGAALDEAKKKGLEEGYGEGLKKGEEDGYIQGLKKCKETLLDLKKLCGDIEQEKAALIAENRRGIFDLALEIAEKVTMTVFSQKDKKALEKMITAAAKEFRSAKNIRVTLSKLDLSEDMEADFKILEKCFSPTVNVEFEAIDGEPGTLLLESDGEILDAGVSTQLKMIGELGRGRFRDKDDESGDGDSAEEARETKPAKAARTARGVKSAKTARSEDEAPAEERTETAAAAEAAEEAETPTSDAAENAPDEG
ncbi:MAG: hypothetical protein NC394_05650 [Bacteroides sp.]|nr:hypothetical protein [Bacteroides sp.]